MHRVVELSGGPLAGVRWPVRFEVDRTLWIGVGVDGGECDGSTRLKAIAIYERAGSEATPRYNFARLAGPETHIAELGRRVTRLRAACASQRWQGPLPAATPVPQVVIEPPLVAARPLPHPDDVSRIAGRVVQRWLRRIESSKSRAVSCDTSVRVEMIVPGEANQLFDFLQQHGIAATLVPTVTQVRRVGSEDCESLDTGAVEFSPADFSRIVDLLGPLSADP